MNEKNNINDERGVGFIFFLKAIAVVNFVASVITGLLMLTRTNSVPGEEKTFLLIGIGVMLQGLIVLVLFFVIAELGKNVILIKKKLFDTSNNKIEIKK